MSKAKTTKAAPKAPKAAKISTTPPVDLVAKLKQDLRDKAQAEANAEAAKRQAVADQSRILGEALLNKFVPADILAAIGPLLRVRAFQTGYGSVLAVGIATIEGHLPIDIEVRCKQTKLDLPLEGYTLETLTYHQIEYYRKAVDPHPGEFFSGRRSSPGRPPSFSDNRGDSRTTARDSCSGRSNLAEALVLAEQEFKKYQVAMRGIPAPHKLSPGDDRVDVPPNRTGWDKRAWYPDELWLAERLWPDAGALKPFQVKLTVEVNAMSQVEAQQAVLSQIRIGRTTLST